MLWLLSYCLLRCCALFTLHNLFHLHLHIQLALEVEVGAFAIISLSCSQLFSRRFTFQSWSERTLCACRRQFVAAESAGVSRAQVASAACRAFGLVACARAGYWLCDDAYAATAQSELLCRLRAKRLCASTHHAATARYFLFLHVYTVQVWIWFPNSIVQEGEAIRRGEISFICSFHWAYCIRIQVWSYSSAKRLHASVISTCVSQQVFTVIILFTAILWNMCDLFGSDHTCNLPLQSKKYIRKFRSSLICKIT